MSAIEFSNERSSENEMDWIRKTNAILSSKLSHHQTEDATRREILYDRTTTHARERKRILKSVLLFSLVAPLVFQYIQRGVFSLLSKSLSSLFLCGKSFRKKEHAKKEQNFSIEIFGVFVEIFNSSSSHYSITLLRRRKRERKEESALLRFRSMCKR